MKECPKSAGAVNNFLNIRLQLKLPSIRAHSWALEHRTGRTFTHGPSSSSSSSFLLFLFIATAAAAADAAATNAAATNAVDVDTDQE